MLFSSLVFLWLFLPAVFLLYRLLPAGWGNTLLLVASLLFYAWGEPIYVLLMLASIALNYLCGLWIDRADGSARKVALALTVCANLGLLGYFKYFDFAASLINGVLGAGTIPLREIALPIGISFYTFQALSYIIDLYRRKLEVQKNPFLLALYISFFPQLIAGPIVQYSDICGQLRKRTVTAAQTAYGIKRFVYGLAKKVLLANAFAAVADEIFGLEASAFSTPLAWYASFLYTLQIYYDFSGYSDMAIGLGSMFGFTFPENFRYPYLSASVGEFWRRWHITLSSWFRNYLYIPLGGNRKGLARTLLNLLIVFFCTGLWHGANLQFIAWGLFHGAFLIIERLLRGKLPTAKWLRIPAHLYTMVVVICGWTLFRAPGLRAGLLTLKAMFIPTAGSAAYPLARFVDGRILCLLALGILLCGVVQTACHRLYDVLYAREQLYTAQCALQLGLLFLCTMQLVSNTYNPFIYFRF